MSTKSLKKDVSKRKICENCGEEFFKPVKISTIQWENRSYCSNKCKAIKRKRLTDEEISNLYIDGWSSNEIGCLIGETPRSILLALKRQNICIRRDSENKKISGSRVSFKMKISQAASGRKCPEHVKEILRNNIGPLNANWGGGKTIGGGYIQYTASYYNGLKSKQPEHRVIAAEKYGWDAIKGMHIHHIDGNKQNNSLCNLRIMTPSDHMKLHAEERKWQ